MYVIVCETPFGGMEYIVNMTEEYVECTRSISQAKIYDSKESAEKQLNFCGFANNNKFHVKEIV